MPAPVLTVIAPPPLDYSDPGILRPEAVVAWTGTTGPDDVLHEWDTDPGFGTPITDSNLSASSPDTGVPPSDMGGVGTTWYYRVTVTDTDDSAFTTSATFALEWFDPQDERRYLHTPALVGAGYEDQDIPGGGWGPDPDLPADGVNILFRRYLTQEGLAGVGFDPVDTPPGGWGPDPDVIAPDGFNIDLQRYLHLLAGKVDTTTPTPHIWYVFPNYGREGWEFRIVGYGFGDTQATYTGSATLNALAVGIISWELVAAVGTGMEIDPAVDLANPVHQLIRASVPSGATSGPVIVCTDGP